MADPILPPGYAAPRQPHPDGVTVLVLGIIGVAIPLVAFPAWFVGNRALADMERHPGRYANADLVRVGRMLGKVISILTVLGLLTFAAVFLFFVLPAANG